LYVIATVPVAPALTVVVHEVFHGPYVMGFGEHESETVGVALLILSVVEAVAAL
jgi:hypothetical protein